MSMVIFLLGFVFLLTGVAYLGYLMELPPSYMAIGIIVLVGAGVAARLQGARLNRLS
jgi:hypothetical protein